MIFDRTIEKREVNANNWTDIYNSDNGYDTTPFGVEMKENTYFSCIRIISESVAKCPIQLKKDGVLGEEVAFDHYLYDLLRLRPNEYMSAIDCVKSFVAMEKHYGIAGLYINRVGGKVTGLFPVKIQNTTIDNAGIIKGVKQNKILYDVIGVENEQFSCFDKDLIVLRDFTMDGINAKANRTIAKESIDTSIKSQNYLNSLFGNGLTNKAVVQLTSDMKDPKDLKDTQAKFNRLYSSSGRIFTVPAGYSVSTLNLTLADAQFEQLRRLSREEIASMMSVPLSKLGLVKENAKSEEQDNLQFLNDCLLVIMEQIEQEMDYKLLTETERKKGYKIRFNEKVLLRTDAKTQADVVTAYVKQGVYSLNTAKQILGIEKLEQDVTTFPSGQVTLQQMLDGKLSYTEKTELGGGGNGEPGTN